MSKRFIVYPGYVESEIDGQKHYINADRLMKLYRVKPQECIVYHDESDILGLNEWEYIHLYPDPEDGNYETYVEEVEKLTK